MIQWTQTCYHILQHLTIPTGVKGCWADGQQPRCQNQRGFWGQSQFILEQEATTPPPRNKAEEFQAERGLFPTQILGSKGNPRVNKIPNLPDGLHYPKAANTQQLSGSQQVPDPIPCFSLTLYSRQPSHSPVPWAKAKCCCGTGGGLPLLFRNGEAKRGRESRKPPHLTGCLVLPSLLLLHLAIALSFPFHLCRAERERGEGKKNPGKKVEQIEHADGKLPRTNNVGLRSSWKLGVLREPLQTLR